MILNRRFLILAGALVAASAAYGAITTDKLIIRGKADRPGIETNAPIPIRYFPTVLTGSYTVSPARGDYSGEVFIVRGSGTRVITLPQPSQALLGYRYTFINDVNQNLTIACYTNKLYFDDGQGTNSWIASELRFATNNRLRGAVITVLCTGTYWYIESVTPNFPYARFQSP
jgi:hypothetical protein